jgi:hypothetical protein
MSGARTRPADPLRRGRIRQYGPDMDPTPPGPPRPRTIHERNPPPTTGQTHTCPGPLDATYGQLAAALQQRGQTFEHLTQPVGSVDGDVRVGVAVAVLVVGDHDPDPITTDGP